MRTVVERVGLAAGGKEGRIGMVRTWMVRVH